MKLSQKEREILGAYELRANAPVRQVRRDLKYREHSIRYAIKRLLDRKVIIPVPLVNMHALGDMVFNIFFSVGPEKKSDKRAFLQALIEEENITWVGEFGGEFQYGLAVYAPHMRILIDILDNLSKRFQRIFFEKAISSQIGTTVFNRKYLSAKRVGPAALSTGFFSEPVQIDQLDDRILRALCSHSEYSRSDLAKKLQVPLSTLELRMKRLEQKKVIVGYMFAANPACYGLQSYKLLIYGKGIDRRISNEIKRYAQTHSDIVYLIECIGNWDYEIGVEAERTEKVSEIIEEIYERFGTAVNSIKLLTKFRDLKIRWYPG